MLDWEPSCAVVYKVICPIVSIQALVSQKKVHWLSSLLLCVCGSQNGSSVVCHLNSIRSSTGAISVGPQQSLVAVYTQMLGLISKLNLDWQKWSGCIDELTKLRLGGNCSAAAICDMRKTQMIKEHLMIS